MNCVKLIDETSPCLMYCASSSCWIMDPYHAFIVWYGFSPPDNHHTTGNRDSYIATFPVQDSCHCLDTLFHYHGWVHRSSMARKVHQLFWGKHNGIWTTSVPLRAPPPCSQQFISCPHHPILFAAVEDWHFLTAWFAKGFDGHLCGRLGGLGILI